MIHEAVDNGDATLVQYLLEHSTLDINEPRQILLTPGKRTPLFFAMKGDITCFRLLCRDPRINVNTCGPNAPTPLAIALNGDIERTLILLLHPDILVSRELYRALEMGGPCLELLLRHHRLDVNYYVLHRLALSNYNPSTPLFLQHPALNINKLFRGKHALDLALLYNPILANMLLDNPALNHPFVRDISILSRPHSFLYRQLAITCLLLAPTLPLSLWLIIFSTPRKF